MIEKVIVPAGGTFPSVYVAPDDAVWLLWPEAANKRIQVTRNGVVRKSLPTDDGAQFARFAALDGPWLGVLYRDPKSIGRLVPVTTSSDPIILSRVTGNQPFAASLEGYAWQDAASGTVFGQRWAGIREVLRAPDGTPLKVRPTGLSRMLMVGLTAPRLSVVFVDDEAIGDWDGPSRQPAWSSNGAVLVEKNPAGGVRVTVGAVTIVLRPGQNTFDPRVAGPDASGTYYIVAWGKDGVVWQWAVTGADFVQPEPPTPVPVPVPVPVPTPTPTPVPIPPRPVPPTEPPVSTPVPDGPIVRDLFQKVIAFYMEPRGLNRDARGIKPPAEVHDGAMFDWLSMAMREGYPAVERKIMTFQEYRDQHPGGTVPPNPHLVP